MGEERVAHKRDRDEHYNAKVKMAVMKNLREWEESRTTEERRYVSSCYELI